MRIKLVGNSSVVGTRGIGAGVIGLIGDYTSIAISSRQTSANRMVRSLIDVGAVVGRISNVSAVSVMSARGV